MFVNILLWTAIGVLGGLLTYFAYPTKKEALGGIILAGVTGAFVGGIFYSILRIGTLAVAIDPIASLAALLTVVIILRIVKGVAPTEEAFLEKENKNNYLP